MIKYNTVTSAAAIVICFLLALVSTQTFDQCIFRSEIPNGYSLLQPYPICNETSLGNPISIDALIYSSVKKVDVGGKSSDSLIVSFPPVWLLPSYVYQTGGTPSPRLLNYTSSLGWKWSLSGGNLYLNGTLNLTSSAIVGDVFLNSIFNSQNVTTQITSSPTTSNSTQMSGSQSPSNSTSPTCTSQFCDWNVAYSKITGNCNKIPCPPWMTAAPVLTPQYWGLCGGCATRWRAVCTNNQGVCCSPWEYCTAGIGCGLPRYPQNCTKNTNCVTTDPGCFEAYSTNALCLIQTGASSCNTKPTDSSQPMNVCEYFTNPGYCPVGTPSVDPVLCYIGSEVSVSCTRDYYMGQGVNGDQGFCLQNTCSATSFCKCRYVDIARNVSSPNGLYKAQIASLQGLETRITRSGTSLLIANNKTASSSYIRKASRVVIRLSWDFENEVILNKEYSDFETSCSSKDCEIQLPSSMTESSGNLFLRIVSDGEIVHKNEFSVIAVVKCDKFIDNWDELFDTSCLTSQQVWIFVLTCILVGLTAIVALISIITMIISSCKWFAERKKAREANQELESRSQFLDDVKRWFRNGSDYFYRRAPATVVLLLMVSGSLGSMDCGKIPLAITKETQCTDSICGVVSSTSFVLDRVGDSICLNIDGVDYRVKMTDSWLALNSGVGYYSSDYRLITESKLRCNYIDVCNQGICANVNARNDRSANGQLSTQWTKSRPGITSCDLVCRDNAIVGDLIDCGCLLVKNNCLYCSSSIDPVGSIWSVSPISGTKSRSIMSVCSEDEASKCVEFEASTSMDGIDISCSKPSTGFENFGLSDYCVIQTQDSVHMDLCSKRGKPQVGLAGEIQAPEAQGIYQPGFNSFVFDPAVVGVRSFSPEGCVWSDTNKFSLSDPLPRVVNGLRWENSSLGVITRSSSSGTTTCVLKTNKNINYFSISEACPEVEVEEDISGCNNCAEEPSFVANIYSSCSSGPVSVSCSQCASIVPEMVSISSQPKQVIFKVALNSPRAIVDICFKGATEACLKVTSNVWSNQADFEFGNVTRVEVETDHRDGPWYNPISWFKNILNNVATWWEWLLMVAFWIILLVGVALALYLCWPVLCAIYKSMAAKCRKIGRKNNRNDGFKSVSDRDIEMMERETAKSKEDAIRSGMQSRRSVPGFF